MRYLLFWWTWLIWYEIYTYLSRKGHNLIAPAHTEVDIADYHALASYIKKIAPDIVINAAWIVWSPNIDWCETHKPETLLTNTNWAVNVAIACELLWIYNVYIWSWCIYQGDNNGNWFSETDEPNYTWSFYSRSKIKTQELLHTFQTLQIRIRMPILSRPHPRNFIDKLVRYTHVINEANSVTVIDDMMVALNTLIDKKATGIYNVVNPWVLFHHDLLDKYKKVINNAHTYSAISMDELLQKYTCAWRSNCMLSTKKLDTHIALPDINSRIDEILAIYKTHI